MREAAVGTLFGAFLGVIAIVGGLIWAGTPRGFPSESDAAQAWPYYVFSMAAIGLVGGLLRPLIHRAYAQLLFSFAAMCGLFVGFGSAPGTQPIEVLLMRAAFATPVAFVIGRWIGGFELMLDEESAIPKGSTTKEKDYPDGGHATDPDSTVP